MIRFRVHRTPTTDPGTTGLRESVRAAVRTAVRAAVRATTARPLTGAVLLAAALLAALPGLALAEGESQGNPWMDLVWKAVNLAVLVGLIVYFARKPVGSAFRTMAKETYDRWTGAHKAAEKAQAEMAAQRAQIEGLAGELQRMVADAQADAARESARVMAEAQMLAERIRINGQQQIEQEMAKARTEMRRQLAEETLRLAEKMIREQATPAERKKLMDSYIQEMEGRR